MLCVQGASFDQTIRSQMLRRQEEVKRKIDAVANARYAQGPGLHPDDKASHGLGAAGADSDEDERSEASSRLARMAAAKRRKPTIMH